MPSIIDGFDYDIFISYRHKDNKYDGWVSEFVINLRKELEATFKEDVSVYFDENADDGLKESHDVDDSLRTKLNCLVFIPIISQTYCDPRSFAWQHEFLYFKQHASSDRIGLKVKLASTNVASRILPIRIHEIDQADKELLERELGGVLRPIDFIFKSSGVNRSMRPQDDERHDSENHVLYRNQINKVANAIKEVVNGIKEQNSVSVKIDKRVDAATDIALPQRISKKSQKRLAFGSLFLLLVAAIVFGVYTYFGLPVEKDSYGKSIAVLPFENMSNDPEQEYFNNGITEDILNHLAKIADLKVKSRTSTLQYKGTKQSISEIANELAVDNIVEGSVRKVGDKVRIVVQLIDAKSDIHLWSETYDRELEDILSVQSEIALKIANALNAKLTQIERTKIEKEASHNVTAYDYFLQARELLNRSTFQAVDLDNAMRLTNESIKLDNSFAQAYGLKGRLWIAMRHRGAPERHWRDSSLYYFNKAIEIDANSAHAYLGRAFVAVFFMEKDKAREDFKRAYSLAPNDPDVLNGYGYQLLRDRDEKGADLIITAVQNKFSLTDPSYWLARDDALYFMDEFEIREESLKKSKALNPGSTALYWNLADLYRDVGKYDQALNELDLANQQSPNQPTTYDLMGWCHYLKGDYQRAVTAWSTYKQMEAAFADKKQTVPFRHRAGMAYLKLGNKARADSLFREQITIGIEQYNKQRGLGSWNNLGGVAYDLAVSHALLGETTEAIKFFQEAYDIGFLWRWGYKHDPAFANLQDDPRYIKVVQKYDDYFEFRKRAFESSFNRLEASNDLKRLQK